jgi:hypothetical protein
MFHIRIGTFFDNVNIYIFRHTDNVVLNYIGTLSSYIATVFLGD